MEKDNKRLKSVSALQKRDEDDDNDSSISTVEGSSHFQDALEMLKEHHPRIVLALKHRNFMELDLRNVLLLDNQSTFDLCCNKKFASKIIKAENALQMTSNGGGLKITKKCKIPGYKYLVWYSKKAITNITRLGILISGSNFWDPHWRRNSDSVYNSEDSGRIFFLKFRFLDSQKIGIPICNFWNSGNFLHRNSEHLFVANLY